MCRIEWTDIIFFCFLRLAGSCCFSHSAYWLPTIKKLLYTVANTARGRVNREKITKEKVWQPLPGYAVMVIGPLALMGYCMPFLTGFLLKNMLFWR